MYKQEYNKLRKVDIILRSLDDKTIEGIMELEDKKRRKEPGEVAFHIDNGGIVRKIKCNKII